jgi:hypothetical protein
VPDCQRWVKRTSAVVVVVSTAGSRASTTIGLPNMRLRSAIQPARANRATRSPTRFTPSNFAA